MGIRASPPCDVWIPEYAPSCVAGLMILEAIAVAWQCCNVSRIPFHLDWECMGLWDLHVQLGTPIRLAFLEWVLIPTCL